MFKRRFKLVGKILLAILAVLLGFLLIERWRGQLALANYKKQLSAQREKLLWRDFAQTFNEQDNGAPAVKAAIEKIQRGVVLPDDAQEPMQVLASGRAKVSFQEAWWITKPGMLDSSGSNEPVVHSWEQMARDLALNTDALTEARSALNKPVLNNNLDYSLGPKIRMPYLSKSKSLARWFVGGTQLALHEGNQAVALENLLGAVRLQDLVKNDKTTISEMVRYAIGSLAKSGTWEALQSDKWTNDHLAQLQNAWQSQRYAAGMVSALEWELVSLSIFYQQLRASNDETDQFLVSLDLMDEFLRPLLNTLQSNDGGHEDDSGDKPAWLENLSKFFRRQVYCRVWRFSWSHQAELKDLKSAYSGLEFARRADTSANYASYQSELGKWLEEFERPGFYNRLRYLPIELRGAYGKFIEKTARMETDRSLVITAIALRRYFLQQNRYPESLETLVPDFVAAVPIDWMDGKPMKYRRLHANDFVLYSVGENAQDDGGGSSPPEGSRRKDLWGRGDYLWPAPATPDEVEEFRREALAR